MMFKPVNALEDGVTPRERHFKRHGLTRQNATLFVNTRFQCAMTRSEFQNLGVHSG
jgi:hypothetical protein